MRDTTGTLVAHLDDYRIAVGVDRGVYPNTAPDLNIRIFDAIETFPARLWAGPACTRIFNGDGAGYGGTWGGGSRLFPVTDADVAALRGEAEALVAREVAREAAREAEEAEYEARVGIHICRTCGTFCEGDCTTSR